jgi:hypothetical protein
MWGPEGEGCLGMAVAGGERHEAAISRLLLGGRLVGDRLDEHLAQGLIELRARCDPRHLVLPS